MHDSGKKKSLQTVADSACPLCESFGPILTTFTVSYMNQQVHNVLCYFIKNWYTAF